MDVPQATIAREEEIATALAEARERTLSLVADVDDADLERVFTPLMSPLVWDLGHIAAYEDLWLVHRHGGEPLLREDLATIYDAFETPRAQRGDLPFLRPPEARAHLEAVRRRALAVLEREGAGDGIVHEMVVRHEHQHNETMLQAMAIAGLPVPAGWRPRPARGAAGTGRETVLVPGGRSEIGAGPEGFSYDNERPRHAVDVPAFEIGRSPLTNGDWLEFIADGGYARSELWSKPGWAWREAEGAVRPLHWAAEGTEWRETGKATLDPARPVMHVSYWEAQAAARWAGGRLPSEAEWETAARRNALEGIGDVWEWTATEFDGYPGFAAHPYPEYSEVFFLRGYQVLRGASWATSARVASPTFRNWDLPQRRQIFSGVRIARDAS